MGTNIIFVVSDTLQLILSYDTKNEKNVYLIFIYYINMNNKHNVTLLFNIEDIMK